MIKKNLLTLIFLTVFTITIAQDKKATGFLFLSLQVKDNSTFDFFIATELDTTKNLDYNLTLLKNDTLIRINLDSVNFSNVCHFEIENDTNKIIKIVPIKAIWNDWIIEDLFLQEKEFIEFPLRINNKMIVKGYYPKRIRSLRQIVEIKMENKQ